MFSATRGGTTYIGTVLNSTDRYADAARMLDRGIGPGEAEGRSATGRGAAGMTRGRGHTGVRAPAPSPPSRS
ncbi:hypothetical protein ACFVS9_29995 [Streptomyces sp. NPDC058008]|uniref:hypothetical protein n=1 Tax=Streptomyces sp. NPDC058008 TaxID=3346303 RepID=UPI0036E1C483